MSVRIEFLYWPECPSHERALVRVREAMRSASVPEAALTIRAVADEAAAQRERFVGSPTVRVNGRDVSPPPADAGFGLSCRLYRHRDGRPSPLPDPLDLQEAIGAALSFAPSPDQESAR